MRWVDLENAVLRRSLVGAHEEAVAVYVDEVSSVLADGERPPRGLGGAQIHEFDVGARPTVLGRQDEPSSVFGELRSDERLWIAGPLAYVRVLRRIGADLVEANFGKARAVRRRNARDGGKPRVIEAVARRRPRGPRVLGPFDDVHVALLPRRDVHDVERRFVGVVALHRVGERLPVPRHAPHAERDAAVGRPRVRIEEHRVFAVFALTPVHGELLFPRVPLWIKPTLTAMLRRTGALDVKELFEARGDGLTAGEFG